MKCLTALMVVMVLAGCAGKKKSIAASLAVPETVLSSSDVDAVGLRVQLLLLADQTSAQIAGTTSEIARRTTDLRVREQTVLFKLRAIPVMYSLANLADARAAYLYSWIFTQRLREYLTKGEGRALFGDLQPLIVEAADGLERSIVSLGYQYFPKAVMDEVRDDIEAIAAANPVGAIIGPQTVRLPETTTAQQRGAVDSILGAPIRSLEGLGSMPEAINAMTQTVEILLYLIKQMPQYIRWQTELLLLQAETQPGVVELRQDVTRISRSIESVAQTVETLPADLRQELDAALAEARQTITAIDTALAKAQTITADVKEATANIKATTDTVNTIVAAVMPPPSEGRAPAETEPGEPFDMKDVVKTTEQLHATTVELRAIVEDLQSGAAQDLLAYVDTASRATIDHAVAQTNTIVDRLTLRIFYLIGALFVVLVTYRFIAVKLIRTPPR